MNIEFDPDRMMEIVRRLQRENRLPNEEEFMRAMGKLRQETMAEFRRESVAADITQLERDARLHD